MITTLLVDAMNTIFTPAGGIDRYELTRRQILKFVGKDVAYGEVKRVYEEKRKTWEHRLPPNHGEKWSFIVKEILLALFFPLLDEGSALAAARNMTDEFLSNPELHEITEDTRRFLKEKGGIRVIIASNQDRAKLKILVWHFGIQTDVHAVHTSTELGAEKPSREFFLKILEKENLLASSCAMVGNNPENDFAGANSAKIFGILYDPKDKYPAFTGPRVRELSKVWPLINFINVHTTD